MNAAVTLLVSLLGTTLFAQQVHTASSGQWTIRVLNYYFPNDTNCSGPIQGWLMEATMERARSGNSKYSDCAKTWEDPSPYYNEAYIPINNFTLADHMPKMAPQRQYQGFAVYQQSHTKAPVCTGSGSTPNRVILALTGECLQHMESDGRGELFDSTSDNKVVCDAKICTMLRFFRRTGAGCLGTPDQEEKFNVDQCERTPPSRLTQRTFLITADANGKAPSNLAEQWGGKLRPVMRADSELLTDAAGVVFYQANTDIAEVDKSFYSSLETRTKKITFNATQAPSEGLAFRAAHSTELETFATTDADTFDERSITPTLPDKPGYKQLVVRRYSSNSCVRSTLLSSETYLFPNNATLAQYMMPETVDSKQNVNGKTLKTIRGAAEASVQIRLGDGNSISVETAYASDGVHWVRKLTGALNTCNPGLGEDETFIATFDGFLGNITFPEKPKRDANVESDSIRILEHLSWMALVVAYGLMLVL